MSRPRYSQWIIAPVNSLGQMIEAGQKVQVSCDKCGAMRELDTAALEALAERVGRAFSLVDRRCRCRLTPGCDGWNGFDYLRGVYRPLRTTEGVYRYLFDVDRNLGRPQLIAMCNRYQPGDRTRIEDHFSARRLRAFNDGPAIVHPRDPGWVVRLVDGETVLDQMSWGFPVALRGKSGQLLKPKPVNNARFDKLGSFWKRWAASPEHRCLIPAARYAEAVGQPGAMTTTWLSVRSAPLFAWAGLWSNSDEWGPVYTGVMTDNCPELAHIHDRSPVILAREDWAEWLSAPLPALARFDRPWPAEDTLVEPTDVLWKDSGRMPG